MLQDLDFCNLFCGDDEPGKALRFLDLSGHSHDIVIDKSLNIMGNAGFASFPYHLCSLMHLLIANCVDVKVCKHENVPALLRLAVSSILSLKQGLGLTLAGPVCSSWIWVNRATSQSLLLQSIACIMLQSTAMLE